MLKSHPEPANRKYARACATGGQALIPYSASLMFQNVLQPKDKTMPEKCPNCEHETTEEICPECGFNIIKEKLLSRMATLESAMMGWKRQGQEAAARYGASEVQLIWWKKAAMDAYAVLKDLCDEMASSRIHGIEQSPAFQQAQRVQRSLANGPQSE